MANSIWTALVSPPSRATPAPGQTTVATRVQELIEEHGSINRAAREIDVEPAYLYRLHRKMAGDTHLRMSDETLEKMGLRRVVIFERIKP